MTLILGLGNKKQVVLLSDRRLTVNGKLHEDESNKALTLVCRDARVAVAFSGLAMAGTFRTRFWLMSTLSEAAAPDFSIEGIINRLAHRAAKDIAGLPIQNWGKALTIVIAGYHYPEGPPALRYWRISNAEVPGEQPVATAPQLEFTTWSWSGSVQSENPGSFRIASGWTDVDDVASWDDLWDMVRQDRPSEALVGKGVEVLRQAARSKASGGRIGEQCTSIVVPFDTSKVTQLQYHTSHASREIYLPGYVEARGGEYGAYALEGSFGFGDERNPAIVAVPKVSRNTPCPCGSRVKYKRCHGSRRGGGMEIRLGGRADE